jgi:acetate kinase
MGMSPQSGLPQNNRVGDFDVFALPAVMRATGKTLEQILDDLANRSGLFGLSGYNDLRDIEADDSPRSRQAIDVFVASIRHYLGAYLLLLNGADAIVFTGGMGENSKRLRAAVCADLDWFGIRLDPLKNDSARGEMAIHSAASRVQLWIMPTNEELVVARQVREYMERESRAC